ncbi:response regulator transcription factor [Aquincola sp. MAHUQ-54]|uniref:Response regulator transcription factor n=1 Tax=Aquincola agrisoli TaxID=3119538 RepID=A0AAW9Q7H7_9BURK
MKALVVDDHPIVRMGLRRLVEVEWPEAAVSEAATLDEALRVLANHRPEIVLLDVALPDAQGTEGLARMRRVAGDVPILMISLNKDPSYAQRLLQMGAAGYVSKDKTGEELVAAIGRVLDKGRYVPPDLADRLLSMLEGKSVGALPHEALTPQEYRVMQLIAAGHRPAYIAQAMHLSVKTVGNYRMRIFAKTGWRNNIELTKYCVQQGLTEPE